MTDGERILILEERMQVVARAFKRAFSGGRKERASGFGSGPARKNRIHNKKRNAAALSAKILATIGRIFWSDAIESPMVMPFFVMAPRLLGVSPIIRAHDIRSGLGNER